ncbi:MAG: YbaB/EbfC family nucleoid-associated protein [Hyalangium sp.]|uniref:YbaB/EbfC family nucleoid-associated protein n=1 Tax=Hyalangium sp. TaxID=2028555 RepID=UPI00389A47EA
MPGIDLNYFIRQANKLTEKIEQRKQELANETVEAKSGEGRVTVVANGVQEIRSIKIDKAAIDPNDPGMLEDLITAAVNAALASSRQHMQKELAKISGGVKIPGVT